MQRTKIVLLSLAALLVVPAAGMAFATQHASALTPQQEICQGLNGTSSGKKCSVSGQSDIKTTIVNVINILSIVAGMAAVIMIVIGGFRYVVSAGDSGGVSAAKNTIIYAIVGLVVIAMAQAIVRFVIVRLTKTA
jgi:hypothetical protein